MPVNLPDPEGIAADLITRAGITYPPVFPDKITKLWPGLRISYDDLDKEGFLVDLGSKGGEIVVKITDVTARRRFTIAHELGHWVLRTFNNSKIACSGAIGSRNRPVEKWCDEFAGALLIPSAWLTQQIRKARIGGLTTFILNGPKQYEVSRDAFFQRVAQATPISICELSRDAQTVIPTRKFLSRRMTEENLLNIISVTRSVIQAEPTVSNRVVVDGFVVLRQRLSRDKGQEKWMLCIFPRAAGT